MDSRDKEIIPNDPYTEEKPQEPTEATDNEATVQTETEKRKGLIKSIKESGFFNLPVKIVFIAFLVSVLVYIVSRFWPAFAEFWTRYPGQAIRFVMAKLTTWIPFSVAEILLLMLPIAAVAYIISSAVSTKRDDSVKNFNRWVRPAVCILLSALFIFFAGFGTSYGRYTLADNLGIEQEPVSAEELYDTAIKLVKDLTPTLENVNFDSTGASVMPYGYDELAEKINDAYEKYAASADFVSHFDSYPKPIALSKPMTYTHIAGVYTFMTGEANINTNYPDFIRPFTVAHEMSHQRGIAREEEANFMAFLVCIGSDDDYVRYGAYADVLNYVLNALYKADTQLYAKVRALMPQELKNEFISYSEYFIAYSDSTASKISGAINDTFLHSQGQSEGVNSYGLVVDLAVAYYKSIKD